MSFSFKYYTSVNFFSNNVLCARDFVTACVREYGDVSALARAYGFFYTYWDSYHGELCRHFLTFDSECHRIRIFTGVVGSRLTGIQR